MKHVIVAAAVACVAAAAGARAQVIAPDWQRASQYYLAGWNDLASEPVNAEKSFQAAIDAYPEFPLAYYGLGRSYMQQKRYQEALTAYLKSQELFRTQGSDRIAQQAGLLRKYQSDPVNQQAVAAAADRRLTTSGPSQGRTATEMELQNQINMLQQAMQSDARTTVVGAVPGFVSLAVGSAYFRLNRLDDAEREYKAAIEASTKYGEAHNNLAVVYLLTGRYDEAEKEVKAAEKAGYKVSPNLKADIKAKKGGS